MGNVGSDIFLFSHSYYFSYQEQTDRATAALPIVVDLRGNGGGLLQGAVEAASLFLKAGEIERENMVSTTVRIGTVLYSCVVDHVFLRLR